MGVTPTVACKDSGAGKSLISNMKNGEIPSILRVELLANYLGCTISDLTGENKELTIPEDSELDTETADFIRKLKLLTPDDLELLKAHAELMIKRRQEN